MADRASSASPAPQKAIQAADQMVVQFPFNNKEEARKWLKDTMNIPKEQRILNDTFHQQIVALDKKFSQKGESWDKHKEELHALYQAAVLALQQPALNQALQMQLNLPVPVVRDPRVDALNQKLQELTIVRAYKKEIEEDLDAKCTRLKEKIVDNEEKMIRLKGALNDRDETIAQLQREIKTLKLEKQELEHKIRELEGQIYEFITTVRDLQRTVKENENMLNIISKANENLAKRNDKLEDEIQRMKEREEEIRDMNESRIVVGEIIKMMVKNMYVYVHPTLPLRKKTFYNLTEIQSHMRKYKGPEKAQEKANAKKRWEELKIKLEWDEDKEEAIQKIVELRNKTAHPIDPPIGKGEIRSNLRKLEADEDIDEDEYNAVFDLYNLCKKLFPEF